MSIFIDYSIFVGMFLYFIAGFVFLNLFTKTLQVANGKGLTFLRLMTICIAVGSFVVFISRFCTLYFGVPIEVGRSIAIVNPMLLLVVGLYLNYLFEKGVRK